MNTRTLVGYLGHDLEIRTLPARSKEVTMLVDEPGPPAHLYRRYRSYYDQLPVLTEVCERAVPERTVGKLSLAVHEWKDGRQVTRWVRLVFDDIEELRWRGVRFFGVRGAKVQVTGHERTVAFLGRDGQPRTLTELVVTSFKVLRKKPRPAAAAA